MGDGFIYRFGKERDLKPRRGKSWKHPCEQETHGPNGCGSKVGVDEKQAQHRWINVGKEGH